jgi:hypothetical protein
MPCSATLGPLSFEHDKKSEKIDAVNDKVFFIINIFI